MPVPVLVRPDNWDDDLDDRVHVPGELQDLPLYHWAPTERRKQITRYGLRPSSRPTTNMAWRAPYVCFADTPSWAWALSGGMSWTPEGEWDLWQTSLSELGPDVVVIPDQDRWSGVYEIRTLNRVPKSRLWLAGHRAKP